MVGLLTSLKWRLWKGSYRQETKRIVVLVIGLVNVIPALFGLAIGATLLAWFEPTIAMPVFVVVGGLGIVLWAVIPLASFGVDDTLAANKFAQFPVRARQLQPGLFAASFISVPVASTAIGALILMVAGIIAITRTGGGVVAIIATPFAFAAGLMLCVLLPRALVTATSIGGVSRRRKELGGILFVVLLLVAIYGLQIFLTAQAAQLANMDLTSALHRIGAIVGWTPFGAPFALPFHLADGELVSALATFAITAASLVVGWLWWRHSLERTLTTGVTDQGGGVARRLKGSFVPSIYSTAPWGAVAARSLRYWFRDKRYLTSLVIMPIVGIVIMVLFSVQGLREAALMAPLLVAWSATATANDFGYDGPATWVNITSGLDAKSNLIGRTVAAMTVFVPQVIVLSVAAVIVAGLPEWLWPLLGGAVGLLGSMLGIAALLSVYLPYRVKSPSASAFSSGSSGGAGAFLSVLIAMFGLFIPMIPAMVLYLLGATAVPWLRWIAPLVALLTGYLVMRLGWYLGARGLSRREPEVFAVVRTWAS